MTTLLVCSVSLAGSLLSTLLAECCGLTHLGICDDERDVMAALESLRPDLLLLDGNLSAHARKRRSSMAKQQHSTASSVWPELCSHSTIRDGSTRLILLPNPSQLPPSPVLLAAAWMVLRDQNDWQQLMQRSHSLEPPAFAGSRIAMAPLPEPSRLASLSPRERMVLSRLAEGLMSKEIARGMGVTRRTIETYRKNISGKLGLSGAQLLRAAVLQECLQLPQAALQRPTTRDDRLLNPAVAAQVAAGTLMTARRSAQQRVLPLARRRDSREAPPLSL